MPQTQDHPTRDELTAFLAGRLPLVMQRAIEGHVSTCDECCGVLAALPEDTLVEQLKGDGTQFASAPLAAQRLADLPIPAELQDHPRYRVERAIGVGGMGVAWLAEHRRMERPVVLKVIRPELLAHPVAIRRFQVEVKAAARLSHPNIVQAHDADQAGDLHFLVMEFVEGLSLAAVVAKRGPLPPNYAISYIRQAAAGLQHAHERGMVHRDIKPQNLMLTPAGQIKILDFGLAQFARDAQTHDESLPAAVPSRTGTIMTAAGSVFGTPDYIAPEQAANSRDVDIRADIYSLGCTFYYLLRGEPPYPLGTAHEKLAAQQFADVPSLQGLRVAGSAEPISDELAQLVRRMMAKSPADRFQTPGEVAQTLAALAKASRKPEPPLAPPVVPPPVIVGTDAFAAFARDALIDERNRLAPASTRGVPRRRTLAIVGIAGLMLLLGATFATVQLWPDGAPSVAPARTGPPRILVLLSPQFMAADYAEVRRALEADAHAEVHIASSGPCTANLNGRALTLQPDVILPGTQPRAADYDALFIPGGNIQPFKEDSPCRRAAWQLIDDFVAADKPIAAIGQGQGVLAIKGTLVGRQVAANSGVRQFLPTLAGEPTQQMVAVDGPIVTATDTRAAWPLAQALLAEIRKRKR